MAPNANESAAGSGQEWKQEFIRDLNEIRKRGKVVNLSDEQIDDLFYRSKWIKETSPGRVFFRQMIRVRHEDFPFETVYVVAYERTFWLEANPIQLVRIGLNPYPRFFCHRP